MSLQPHAVPDGVQVLGVTVHRVSWDEALARLRRFIEERGAHHVVTVNPEFLVQARGDAAFHRVLEQADLALADGIGVLWAARLLGRPLPCRIPGVDLIERLAEMAAARGYRIFFLGAAPGVGAAAARVLAERHPGLTMAGVVAGSPAPEEEEALARAVSAARADVLLVAFGAPQQDLWIHRNRERLNVPVCIGVGGSFDYIGGRVRRAPRWMRRAGLEWLFRLVLQPWRWKRQLRLPLFVLLVSAQWLRERQTPLSLRRYHRGAGDD